MTEGRACEVLISPDLLYWVKDRDQILIVNERGKEIHALDGIEAIVWTWMTLEYSYPKIVQLMAVMLGLPSDESEQRLLLILQNLQGAGILAIQTG